MAGALLALFWAIIALIGACVALAVVQGVGGRM